MNSFARLFIALGVVFLLIGVVLYVLGRFNLPLGRLPGDIRLEGRNFTCLFPLGTSLLLSVALTVLLNLIVRLFNR
ncbi:MAG: DUF2905 domain-containing protein [Anaerolineae bacterium]|nr:MAG: DUF2905 domain-containing protein [Anaerolineae bacterium]